MIRVKVNKSSSASESVLSEGYVLHVDNLSKTVLKNT